MERGPGGTQARREARCVPGSKPLLTGRDWRHARTGRQMTAAPARAERSSARRPASTPRHVDSSSVYRISRSHKQEVSTTRSQTIMTTCGTRLCASDKFFIQLSLEKTNSLPLNKGTVIINVIKIFKGDDTSTLLP